MSLHGNRNLMKALNERERERKKREKLVKTALMQIMILVNEGRLCGRVCVCVKTESSEYTSHHYVCQEGK